MPETQAAARGCPRSSAWSRVLAARARWSVRFRAELRRIGGRLRVAIATRDGRTLDATYHAASSFVLYDQTSTTLEYAGLIACSFRDPGGRAESELRREALSDLDLVFVLDEDPAAPAAEWSSGPQLVRCSAARPIEELVRELESRSLQASSAADLQPAARR